MSKRISPLAAAIGTACVIGLGGVVLAQSSGDGGSTQSSPQQQGTQNTMPSSSGAVDNSTTVPPPSSTMPADNAYPSTNSPSTTTQSIPPSAYPSGTQSIPPSDSSINDRASGTSGSMSSDPNATSDTGMRAARTDRN